MANEHKGKRLKLWTSATYRITVEGHLDEGWSDRLGGMRITTHTRADKTTGTTLVGRMRDQAELTGVLNTLYELHLPILSVKNIIDSGHEGRQYLIW
ncbi:MAG: hypothetical protein GQ575_07005 [Deltaproteobacteria bacterium]|nr:hypothetical protein [Deltaproteobacteria bacterium]